MHPPLIHLVCSGCGALAPVDDPFPFRCPQAQDHDDVDHLLSRGFEAGALRGIDARAMFLADETHPFRKYRKLLYSYQTARAGGLSDEDYLALVDDLDAAVARVDGHGFRATPLARFEALERATGVSPRGALWVKNETGNVSGSHKARHLMGIMLWIQVVERLGVTAPLAAAGSRLAIASCGNAALAAAVVAKAAAAPLDVFVPPDADAAVLDHLTQLGAHLTICHRRAGESGDPCYLRFREAVQAGGLPFSVQGPDNGLTLEGGLTLGYELVSDLLVQGERLDRLFIQVGGGALASSCVQALEEAHELGLIDRLPRIHAVQTEGGSPLTRAYERVAARVLGTESGSPPSRSVSTRVAEDVLAVGEQRIEEALDYAATHRSEFMWPWETPPRSIATGILDDETYDWLAVVRAMLHTGGFPVVASERALEDTNRLARAETNIAVDATGTAGLAGWAVLAKAGVASPDEHVAVLFTGAIR